MSRELDTQLLPVLSPDELEYYSKIDAIKQVEKQLEKIHDDLREVELRLGAAYFGDPKPGTLFRFRGSGKARYIYLCALARPGDPGVQLTYAELRYPDIIYDRSIFSKDSVMFLDESRDIPDRTRSRMLCHLKR